MRRHMQGMTCAGSRLCIIVGRYQSLGSMLWIVQRMNDVMQCTGMFGISLQYFIADDCRSFQNTYVFVSSTPPIQGKTIKGSYFIISRVFFL